MNSWADLELKHLFYAYRKAKADIFFDHVVGAPLRFAAYEQNLARNLEDLLGRLKAGAVDAVLIDGIGKPRLVAKKLGKRPRDAETEQQEAQQYGEGDGTGGEPHAFFSDAPRAVNKLRSQYRLIPEFRLVGDFDVEYHVVSALWVNEIGHRFDACLDKSAYGARIRRHGVEGQQGADTIGDYAVNAIGSLWPYVAPYRRWRGDGMRALRSELEAGRRAIAVTLDIASFYHRVDPSFMVDARFLASLSLELGPWEIAFTESICESLAAWAKLTYDLIGEEPESDGAYLGLPIGLTSARILANLTLRELDQAIQRELNPIHYGRYVDDILIVMHDPGHFRNGRDLLDYIVKKTSAAGLPNTIMARGEDGAVKLRLASSPKSQLTLQPAKQRIFFLSGQSGLDLIDTIESTYQRLTSERRLMPLPGGLEKTASAMILAATDRADDEAVTVGRSDGLTVRRLGWAVQLRAVETLAAALPPQEWRPQRQRFYKFACDHVIRGDRILEQMDSLVRLVALAASLSEWDDLLTITNHIDHALTALKPTAEDGLLVNAFKPDKSRHDLLWRTFRASVDEMLGEAVLRAMRPHLAEESGALPEWATKLANEAMNKVYPQVARKPGPAAVALALVEADLAIRPHKEYLQRFAKVERKLVDGESELYPCYAHFEDLREFLILSRRHLPGQANRVTREASAQPSGSLLPYLFPTRPYDPEEVSLYVPDACFSSAGRGEQGRRNWARLSRAVKGAALPPSLAAALHNGTTKEAGGPNPAESQDVVRIFIGTAKPPETIRLGIPSLLTQSDNWATMASGKPANTLERFERIERVVNFALTTSPSPTYLVLPELSIPEQWLGLVSSRLLESKISLIAGLDYQHDHSSKSVHSSAALVLYNDSLAFSKAVQLRQPKAAPAPGEEYNLLHQHGLKWTANSRAGRGDSPAWHKQAKPIYVHNGFVFGVLVCSELQNMRHRTRFQGEIDLLTVLSWNQDLTSFDALVNASALDIHAYIALVNNRQFGGSRVRAPAREPFRRELCHLHGGENDQLAVVEIDVAGLRKFHRRHKRWPKDRDYFKPVPEDFELSDVRRRGT